jgi:hypothetical protein
MPTFDERLKSELERAGRGGVAPDPRRVFEDVVRRRARRETVGKVRTFGAVAAIVVALVGVFLLIDGGSESGVPMGTGTPTSSAVPPPPASMLQWRPVIGLDGAGEPTCDPGACSPDDLAATSSVRLVDSQGQVYALGPAITDGTHARVVGVSPPQRSGFWVVSLQLDTDATSLFEEATTTASEATAPQDQIAVVWQGEILQAVTVQEPITSGTLQLMMRDESTALALAARLGAAAPSSPAPVVEGRDIGLDTNVCEAQRLGGLDLVPDGIGDVAWTGFLVGEEGRCAVEPDQQDWIVAVDLTGDGTPDASGDLPLVNCPYVGCAPLGAADLDADGDGELIVRTWFSVNDQGYFAIEGTDGTYAIAPIAVAAPGDPAAGVEPGEPLQTSTGGDAGLSAWVRCEGYPEAPVLVYAWVFADIAGAQRSEWHEVKLRLHDDGLFHVVDSTDVSLPPGEDPGFVRSDAPACGVDFTP